MAQPQLNTDSCNHTWLGYITAEVIRQCIMMCNEECLACAGSMTSPLLHFHNEISLKEKVTRYINSVTLNIEELFDQFIIQFGWFSLNRDHYIQVGNTFLLVTTPDALFYGKYITPQNDKAIYGSGESKSELSADLSTAQPIRIENQIKRKAKPPKKPIKVKIPRAENISDKNVSGQSL